jgi:uncharacterized protein YbbC (DUF1343 family)
MRILNSFFCFFAFLFFLPTELLAIPKVLVGIDLLFCPENSSLLKGKRVGLITNHTAIDNHFTATHEILKQHAKDYGYTLTALFSPEHGFHGQIHATESIKDSENAEGIPIYSLYGDTRRPTQKMLSQVDLLIYDIQDIGCRSYTYETTLFYAMEEAAKLGIPLIVLDRPNPINGIVVDGPMLEEKWRSIVGYINVPYCHGMTMGELARFFNEEYHIGCILTVIAMKGWHRGMTFSDTQLPWIPTSPNVPEATTALYYPITGLLGELSFVSIGGALMPFRLVGSPWINAAQFAEKLNAAHLPGVYFFPFYFRPVLGKYVKQDCQGVYILVTDHKKYLPFTTQYLLLGTLKSLYPKQFSEALISATRTQKELFFKISGTEQIYRILLEKKHVIWPLRGVHQQERNTFLNIRAKYLIPSYTYTI